MRKRKAALSKRFVRWGIALSTLLMVALCIAGLRYWKQRPTILANRAAEALAAGDYDRAIKLYESLEQTDEIAEALLSAKYGAAVKLHEAGQYEAAETAFSALGDYADARTQILACRYAMADRAMQAGDFVAAKELFYALSGYRDALTRYNESLYAIADATEATDAEAAFTQFYALGGFFDALQRAQAIAIRLTGMADAEDAVNVMLGVSEEEILQRNKLEDARDALPRQALAVGFYHTVGRNADGTVVAAGSNSDGQCNVTAWTGIVAIDCGAFHTVGLKSDGTVVAVGRNESGQCNVSDWAGIVAIACTDYDTIGLKSDGTVVHTGYHDYTMLDGWSDVVTIGGGSYAVVALTGSGQLLASHPSSRSESIRGAVAADASTGYAIALLPNGTVLGTSATLLKTATEPAEIALSWQDVVQISAGSTGVLGLTADGTVLTLWFRDRDALDFSDVTNAIAVASGGTHSAVLQSDGTVVTRGTNDYGECNTAGWHLATK